MVSIAFVKEGTTWRWFIDGVLNTEGTVSTVPRASVRPLEFGVFVQTSRKDYLNGYLDEVRVSQGIARWNDTFTPPTSHYGSNITIGNPEGLYLKLPNSSIELISQTGN